MSEVISFRLDPNNPREAQALDVLARHQERGYSIRQILTEALLRFDQANTEHSLQGQLAAISTSMKRVADQIERLERTGIQRSEPIEEKQAVLSDAFILSVKSAAKSGITAG